jgi:hypothetical protein
MVTKLAIHQVLDLCLKKYILYLQTNNTKTKEKMHVLYAVNVLEKN